MPGMCLHADEIVTDNALAHACDVIDSLDPRDLAFFVVCKVYTDQAFAAAMLDSCKALVHVCSRPGELTQADVWTG